MCLRCGQAQPNQVQVRLCKVQVLGLHAVVVVGVLVRLHDALVGMALDALEDMRDLVHQHIASSTGTVSE